MERRLEEIAEYYLCRYGQQIRYDMKRGTTPRRIEEQIVLRKQLAKRITKEIINEYTR